MRLFAQLAPLFACALAGFSPEALAKDARTIFQRVSDSVVRIEVRAGTSTKPVAGGSGIVLSNGTVVTNCHVLEKGDTYAISLRDQRLDAKLLSGNVDLDLCLLQHEPMQGLKPVKLGYIALLKTGERVFAVGSPLGLENSISEGIVSSIRKVDDVELIQTTAAISPGSSGGGLFNDHAELIGITTFQFRGQNLNFAVPSDYIARVRMAGLVPNLRPASAASNASTDTTLAYKGIPLGLPLREFSRIKPGCRCTELPHLAVCSCYGETYFGAPASTHFFFRDASRLYGVSVLIPPGPGMTYSGDIGALFSEMRSEFARAHSGPGTEETGKTKEGGHKYSIRWTIGAYTRTLTREHASASPDSPIQSVAVVLEEKGNRINKKDY